MATCCLKYITPEIQVFPRMSCQRSVWPLALAPPDGLKCKSCSHSKPQVCSGPALHPTQLQQWIIRGFQTPLQTAGSSHLAHPSLFPTANLQLNATKNTVNTLLTVFHTGPSGGLLLLLLRLVVSGAGLCRKRAAGRRAAHEAA